MDISTGSADTSVCEVFSTNLDVVSNAFKSSHRDIRYHLRLSKLQSDQFAELDEKLRKVEDLREQNKRKEDELKAAIRENQNLRAINIHRSGLGLQGQR